MKKLVVLLVLLFLIIVIDSFCVRSLETTEEEQLQEQQVQGQQEQDDSKSEIQEIDYDAEFLTTVKNKKSDNRLEVRMGENGTWKKDRNIWFDFSGDGKILVVSDYLFISDGEFISADSEFVGHYMSYEAPYIEPTVKITIELDSDDKSKVKLMTINFFPLTFARFPLVNK